jgi:sigma-E factor negative regulatory protein RseA
MSEGKFETVSMLVDNYQATPERLDKILHDEELSTQWENYHIIGDVIRGETPNTIQLDLSDKIAAAIAEEPTILSPKSAKHSPKVSLKPRGTVVNLFKPLGQVAIAASAAWLMILGVQQANVADADTAMPQQVIQTIPLGGIAEPVSLNIAEQPSQRAQQQAYIEQQRRFQALLIDHQQQIKLNSVVVESKAAPQDVEGENQVK